MTDIAKILKLFPKTEFAFKTDYINRHSALYLKKKKPVTDIVLAVSNAKEFHKANYEVNNKHYGATARLFKGKIVPFF